jgi:hypothetical protein
MAKEAPFFEAHMEELKKERAEKEK